MNSIETEIKKFSLSDASKIAFEVLEKLKPYCERIEIAGSIRREKQEVKDIEIVAIPKPYQTGLFQDGLASVVNSWVKVKGEMEYGKTKYTQRILPNGIKLDLFFANELNWGLIFAIRTGSAEFSHKVLATKWVKLGYKSNNGLLYKNEKQIEVREEIDLFNLIGLPYIKPQDRSI